MGQAKPKGVGFPHYYCKLNTTILFQFFSSVNNIFSNSSAITANIHEKRLCEWRGLKLY